MKRIFCFLIVALPICNIAFACSYLMPENPRIELSMSDAVFIGQVIQIGKSKEYGYDAKFKVLKSFKPCTRENSVQGKGILDEFVIVNTGFGNGDCGYPFKENEEYLVYAYSYQETFSTGIYGRTKPLSMAQEDLTELNQKKDNSETFPITQRKFLMGTAGFVPRHFPKFKPQDVLDYWDDVAKASELYGIHTNWRDNKKTTGSIPKIVQVAYQISQQKNFDLLIVLGFEIGKKIDLATKKNPVNNWTNRDAIEEYVGVIRKILSEYKNVKFLCVGNEVNMYYERYPEDFDNFITAYIEIYDKIEKEFPQVQIGTNFNLETLKGKGYLTGEMLKRKPEWFLIKKFQDKFDFISFTTYPYFDIGNPQDIPEDYFKEIINHTNKPIGFTEIGWMARERYGGKYSSLNRQGFTGSEDEQVEYLLRFIKLTKDMDIKFANWIFINDISNWKEGDVPSQNVLFDSIGLKYNDGRPKKIWAIWLNLRKNVPWKGVLE